MSVKDHLSLPVIYETQHYIKIPIIHHKFTNLGMDLQNQYGEGDTLKSSSVCHGVPENSISDFGDPNGACEGSEVISPGYCNPPPPFTFIHNLSKVRVKEATTGGFPSSPPPRIYSITKKSTNTILYRGGSRTSPRRGRQSLGGAPTQYFSRIF